MNDCSVNEIRKADEKQLKCKYKSISLLGKEVVEFFFRNESINVEIGSFNHFLEDVVIDEFSEFFGDSSEILQCNESGVLVIDGDEDFVDFFSGLVGGGSGGHHLEELIELNQSAAVLVEFSDHLIHCLSLGFDTEGVDGDLEFWG